MLRNLRDQFLNYINRYIHQKTLFSLMKTIRIGNSTLKNNTHPGFGSGMFVKQSLQIFPLIIYTGDS